jgi:hypothetical protein
LELGKLCGDIRRKINPPIICRRLEARRDMSKSALLLRGIRGSMKFQLL